MAKPPERGAGRPGEGGSRLSEADRALWEQVAKTARPLKDRETPRPVETPARSSDRTEKAAPKPPPAAPKPRGPSPLLDTPRRGDAKTDLAHGTVAGVDRRQAVRLRRGQLPIDGRLDLHGDTQAAAHRRLNSYLADAQASGKRCVLVVTGRGLGKAEGGVLKAQVPRWLNLPPNRDRVLAFDVAQPKHGGDGALYVLLKRDRKG